jgi:hypothetical protein
MFVFSRAHKLVGKIRQGLVALNGRAYGTKNNCQLEL